jgi:hypothetical protein
VNVNLQHPSVSYFISNNNLESVLLLRQETLGRMLKDCYDVLDSILEHKVCKPGKYYQGYSWHSISLKPESHEACRALMLGSYVSSLLQNNLYPTKATAESLQMSVTSLSKILSGIQVLAYHSEEDRRGQIEHTACTQVNDLAARVERALKEIPSPVLSIKLRDQEELKTEELMKIS